MGAEVGNMKIDFFLILNYKTQRTDNPNPLLNIL